MLADYHTKPLIGEKFKIIRTKIMNMHNDWTAGVYWQILQLYFIFYTNKIDTFLKKYLPIMLKKCEVTNKKKIE